MCYYISMPRTFKPEEFVFNDNDFATPGKLLACLGRMDPAHINTPGYAKKLYDAVTNEGNFDSDEWVDMCFEIGSRAQLREFAGVLSTWHQENSVQKQYMPDILASSFSKTPWVQEDLTAVGMAPSGLPGVQPQDQTIVQGNLVSFGM